MQDMPHDLRKLALAKVLEWAKEKMGEGMKAKYKPMDTPMDKAMGTPMDTPDPAQPGDMEKKPALAITVEKTEMGAPDEDAALEALDDEAVKKLLGM